MNAKSILTVFLFLFVSMSFVVAGQEKMVEELMLRGYKSVSEEAILKNIKTRSGDKFLDNQIQQDFEAVMRMGVFDQVYSSVHISDGLRGGKVIVFHLKEK